MANMVTEAQDEQYWTVCTVAYTMKEKSIPRLYTLLLALFFSGLDSPTKFAKT